MINIEHFLIRTGMKKADICRALGMDPKSSSFTHYVKGRAIPPYEKVVELIKLGMNLDELFDADIVAILKKNSFLDLNISELSDDECRKIVERGYRQLEADKRKASEQHTTSEDQQP